MWRRMQWWRGGALLSWAAGLAASESSLSLVLLSLAQWAVAADLTSGPEVGKELKAFKVHVATGDQAGKEVDYVDQRKDKPTVYVFVDADRFDRPMARYLKTLDKAVKSLGGDSHVVAVWLTGDQDKTKEYLPRANMSLQFEATDLAHYGGAKSGPDGWGINDMASLTAVVAKGKQATATFAYESLNESDVPKVEEALKNVVK